MLRAQLEKALAPRVQSPFTDITHRAWEQVDTGIGSLDMSLGGMPRGAITEICGSLSSGRTSIALSILAAASAREEVCALVDGTDAFDPESGALAGLDLRRLLWVRCRNLDQVLRCTDLLLQGGGFGVVAVDLSDLPQEAVRGVPLASWFRFQRTIENTPTSLLLIGRENVAKSAAALVLNTRVQKTEWSSASVTTPSAPAAQPPLLFEEGNILIEVMRSRNPQPASRQSRFTHYVRLYSRS